MEKEQVQERLRTNLASVRKRIRQAAERVGRAAAEIELIAVTKYVDADMVRSLIEAGVGKVAESRPQVLWDKREQIHAPDVEWHLIGHLQRNKVRRTIPLVSMIHSVDSLRLLNAIDEQAESLGLVVPCLLEVNISGQSAKSGFTSAQIVEACQSARRLKNVALHGLMGMGGLGSSESELRQQFANLRELRDQLRADVDCDELSAAAEPFMELSMGMSNDFELAIEEGATLIRLGSILFEGLM